MRLLPITKVKITLFVAYAFSLIALSAHAELTEKTFDVSKGGALYLKTDVGSLDIDTHDEDTVLLEVQTRGDDADKFELSYEVDGADLKVIGEVERSQGWGWNRDLQVKFLLTVPSDYNLDLNTSGGSIRIEDLVGNIDANTSGGSITVGKIHGRVDLHTSGGSIKTKAIHGPLDAHTSGGSINVTFAEQLSESAKLNTSGGSITAYLIEDIKIDIDASTSGGRVRSEFDVDGRVKKKSVRGEINGGGPKLKLHTSGGSISIKSL